MFRKHETQCPGLGREKHVAKGYRRLIGDSRRGTINVCAKCLVDNGRTDMLPKPEALAEDVLELMQFIDMTLGDVTVQRAKDFAHGGFDEAEELGLIQRSYDSNDRIDTVRLSDLGNDVLDTVRAFEDAEDEREEQRELEREREQESASRVSTTKWV